MIILDYNIPEDQVKQLRRWRIHFRQIGHDVGRPEWDDKQEILRYLHSAKQPTFFTRDLGFFRRQYRHVNFCLVVITGPIQETAPLIRKLLRYSELSTKAKRHGKIVKISPTKIAWWEIGQEIQHKRVW